MARNAITSNLSPEEMRIVEYLIEDWKKRYRVTNIKQGIEAFGLAYQNEMRMRISSYLKVVYARSAIFSERLKKWGPETFILTNEEKLVARCLLLNFKRFRTLPMKTEIEQAVDLDQEQVNIALDVLYWLGFIDKYRNCDPLKNRLSRNYEKFLQGLGFTFHTVTLENGIKFNVQCSADALILATSEYADQSVTIDDSCFHCLERLRITMRKGKVISQESKEIRLYDGTECGSTNFFSSEEHFQEWIAGLSPVEAQRLRDSGKLRPLEDLSQLSD